MAPMPNARFLFIKFAQNQNANARQQTLQKFRFGRYKTQLESPREEEKTTLSSHVMKLFAVTD